MKNLCGVWTMAALLPFQMSCSQWATRQEFVQRVGPFWIILESKLDVSTEPEEWPWQDISKNTHMFVWNSIKNHCIGWNIFCVIALKRSGLQTTPPLKFWAGQLSHHSVCDSRPVNDPKHPIAPCCYHHWFISDKSYTDWQGLWSLTSCQVR